MKRGESRADSNRRIRQEAVRESIKAKEHIRQIGLILERDYLAFAEPDLAIKEAKLKMDGHFKILNKVLPDLSASHVTTDEGKTIEDWLDELESPKTQSTEG